MAAVVFVLHAAASLVPILAFGDPSCWLGVVTYETCCDPIHGAEGNAACWGEVFSFQRCCAVDPCLYELQPYQRNCWDSSPSASMLQDALKVIQQAELKRSIVGTSLKLEQKDQIGFDPMASTAFLAADRFEGLPGYGEPGFRARIYYELACQSAHLLSRDVLSTLCPKLPGYVLDQDQTLRKIKLLHIVRLLTSDMYQLGGYLFRIAIELLGWLHLSRTCYSREHISHVLASSLQRYWEKMAKALQELFIPQSYAPGMGSTSNVIAERMSYPALIDFWKKLVEGVMFAPCLDVILNCIILVSYIAEETVRLRTHAFAQLYVAELRTQRLPEDAPNVVAPTEGQQFVFQHHRCCLRYHVLLQLLEEQYQKRDERISMIELGVHTASTAKYLLDRAPFLQWTGIDSYADYGSKGSGDVLFAEALQRLAPFGERAQLLRMSSSEAWETVGPLRGFDENSVDLLFVDGDHDYNATFQDLKSWSRFVRSGGIISGHDIFNPVNDGVTDAVQDLLHGSKTVVRFATDHTYWWFS